MAKWRPKACIEQRLLNRIKGKVGKGLSSKENAEFVQKLLSEIKKEYSEESVEIVPKPNGASGNYYKISITDRNGNPKTLKHLGQLMQYISDELLPIKPLWEFADTLAKEGKAAAGRRSGRHGAGGDKDSSSEESGSSSSGGEADEDDLGPATAAAAAAGGGVTRSHDAAAGASGGVQPLQKPLHHPAAAAAAAAAAGGQGPPAKKPSPAAAAAAGGGGLPAKKQRLAQQGWDPAAARNSGAAAAAAGGGGPSLKQGFRPKPALDPSKGITPIDLTQDDDVCSHRGCALAGRPVGFCKHCTGPVCIDELCTGHCPEVGGIGSNDICAHCRNPFGVLARTTCTACPMGSRQIHSGDTCRPHPRHPAH